VNAQILRRVLALSTLIALSGVLSAQTTWYVDAAATPPGLGTAANPYSSIQYAVDRPTTVAGDILEVAPGNYLESMDVAKAITIHSSQGPLLTTIHTAGPGDGIFLHHPSIAAMPLIEGFTIRPQGIHTFGVYAESGTLRRCIVRDYVTGIGMEPVFATIESSTFVNNRIGIHTGLNGHMILHNSIVWGNWEKDLGGAGVWQLSYTDTDYPWGGTGMLDTDPLLWDLGGGDVQLRPGSPCIDAGDPASPLDPDGSRADMGAVPFDAGYALPPSTYCAGKLNSQGCVPSIGWRGQASASSPAPFVVSAANEVPNKSGLLFFGFAPRAQAFQGGLHCVQLPTKRVGVQVSGGSAACSGNYSFDMGAYIQSGVHPGLLPGAIVYCQWWGRDPGEPSGFQTSLTNSLRFGIAP